MTLVEQFARQHARQIVCNGEPALVTDGSPLLVEAFKELGWSDPYPLTEKGLEDRKAEAAAEEARHHAAYEQATIESPEHAVEARPEGHVG